MIHAREIYNIEIDRSSLPSSYTIAVYVWKGLKESPPLEAEYSITKENTEGLSDLDYVNISPLVLDFIEPVNNEFSEGINNYNDVVWVKWEVYLNEDVLPSQEDTVIAINGFETVDKEILLNGSELSMYSEFIVPFKEGNTLTVKSYPNLEIDEQYVTTNGTLSSNQFRHVLIKRPSTDKYVEVSTGLEKVYIYVEEVSRYDSNELKFVNSFGCVQLLPFYSERKEKLNTTKEKYKSKGNGSGHKVVNFNTNGNISIDLKSNYHSEQSNDSFEAMFLSDLVWCNNEPVNLESTALSYKTRLNDKVISYSITLSESRSKINTY